MKVVDISQIPYKEKKDFLNNLFLMYRKFFISDRLMTKFSSNLTSQAVSLTHQAIRQELSLFSTMLEILHPDQRMILQREFLDKESNSLWYEEYWSKSMYYKLKHEAVDRILLMMYV